MENADIFLERLQQCNEIFHNGGGIFNVVLSEQSPEIHELFHPDWVVHHFQSIYIVTVDLPPYGVYSLMHYSIESFEEERNDIQPLEDGD
jgi:hypothetical protein